MQMKNFIFRVDAAKDKTQKRLVTLVGILDSTRDYDSIRPISFLVVRLVRLITIRRLNRGADNQKQNGIAV